MPHCGNRTPDGCNVAGTIERLADYCQSRDFQGWDPYDALNSPLLRMLSLGLKYPRIAVIQAMKRSPINLRRLFLVKQGHNPKGLGLFLWGFAKLYAIDHDPKYLEPIDRLLDLLDQLRSPRCSGNGWGYNFDWQSRAFFVPKFTATIVNSSFIGHALLDTYRFTGRTRALDMALPIQRFLLDDLHRTGDRDSFCFSYTPVDQLIVHNANLLGASLLIRLHAHDASDELASTSLASLRYSMDRQRADGSWWYADTDYQQWIDSFHTGFNLQSIKYFLDEGFVPQYHDAYERGVQYYAERFFQEDGTARYFHDRDLPLDIHSFAQAIVFFSRLGDAYESLTDRVLQRMIELFYDPRGYFYFQQRRRRPIRIPYMRWSQSWAFHALTEYRLQTSRPQISNEHHDVPTSAPA